jgi:tetratricopeptide (TPR) repeat protein
MKKFFVLALTSTLIIMLSNSDVFIGEPKNLFYPPPISLKYFTFGYDDMVADLFWLRLQQDFGICEQQRGGSSFSADSGKRVGRNRTPSCRYGWGYHMLNLITDLAPRFTLPALLGPMILSVVADDIDGATILFDKSLNMYPNNWELNYRAGYHFMLELEDRERASLLFQKSYENGGPKWLPLLIARVQSEQGRFSLAEKVISDLLKKMPEEKIKKRAIMKLQELKKKMAESSNSAK